MAGRAGPGDGAAAGPGDGAAAGPGDGAAAGPGDGAAAGPGDGAADAFGAGAAGVGVVLTAAAPVSGAVVAGVGRPEGLGLAGRAGDGAVAAPPWVPPACAPKCSRTRRATGGSTAEEAALTNSPSSLSQARITLEVTFLPVGSSSFASS